MKTNQKKHKIQKFGSTESQHVEAVADDDHHPEPGVNKKRRHVYSEHGGGKKIKIKSLARK
jgi:hypothetical protein